MDGKDLIQFMKESIQQARSQNLSQATIGDIENWVSQLEKINNENPTHPPSEIELEKYKSRNLRWIEDVKLFNARNLEVFKAVFQFGIFALKTILLINGGAAIAWLAFMGTLVTHKPEISILFLTRPLLNFSFGVLVAALASGATYLTQAFYGEFQDEGIGNILRVVTVSLVLLAYFLFVEGAYSASEIIIK